jgi:hypothetical protein
MDFTGFPHPKRDDRAPYGRIERQMLSDRCGSDETHGTRGLPPKNPEFAAEYEAELRRRTSLNN